MTRSEPAKAGCKGNGSCIDLARSELGAAVRPTRNGEVPARRLLGSFYTPDDLAAVLTRWALSDGPGTILDPSYGGCAFLRAAVKVLREHRAEEPSRLVFGVDVNPDCVSHADGLVADANHITADFLALRPESVSGVPFRAIVGNPPYIRHHWLKGSSRRAAESIAERANTKLNATASTWAYFVLHALDFLAPDGRLAMLVPEAILQASYAQAIREVLQKRFKRVVLVHLRDRVFNDTDEPVVVIAAEGLGPGNIYTQSVRTAEDLTAVLSGIDPVLRDGEFLSNGREVSPKVVGLVADLTNDSSVKTLEDLATIRIGFVTGANHFFIRTQREIDQLGIPRRALERIIGRTQWLKGLEFTEDDHRHLTASGRRTLLVRPMGNARKHRGIQAWLEEGEEQGIHSRYKCSIRDPWFQVDTGARPDAFVTCSRMAPPLLVINRSSYRCSNALHAIRWHDHMSATPEEISVAFLSSLTAVWAEIHGRRYGGGVLKLEPGTLRLTPIPLIAGISDAFPEISSLLRSGKEDRARATADDAVLRQGMGLSAANIMRLQRAQKDLAQQRIPMRNGTRRG